MSLLESDNLSVAWLSARSKFLCPRRRGRSTKSPVTSHPSPVTRHAHGASHESRSQSSASFIRCGRPAGAKSGVRETRKEKYGVTECAWKDPSGVIVFVAQESCGSNSAMDEARSLGQAIVAGNMANARKVGYEILAGIGLLAADVRDIGPDRGQAARLIRILDSRIWLAAASVSRARG